MMPEHTLENWIPAVPNVTPTSTPLQFPADTSVIQTKDPSSAGVAVDIDPAEKTNIVKYFQELNKYWTDMPRMNILYEDMAYIIPVPVKEKTVPNLAKAFLKIPKMIKGIPKKDFEAMHSCNGVLLPGSTTMVIAPPGHGKSTYLKALAGLYHGDSNLKGTIKYNGMSYDESAKCGLHIHKMCAYVDQGDIHLPLVTVKENFEFAADNSIADIKLLGADAKAGFSQLHQQKAELVIEALGLQSCRNTIVGSQLVRGVSGGEKRRVTIGELFITNARALLLDQPTTGLDTATAIDVLKALQQWAKISGGILVVSLLQPTPEMVDLFDDTVLMCDGFVVYHGPTADIAPYFHNLGIPFPKDQDLADAVNEFLCHPAAMYHANIRRLRRQVEGGFPMSPLTPFTTSFITGQSSSSGFRPPTRTFESATRDSVEVTSEGGGPRSPGMNVMTPNRLLDQPNLPPMSPMTPMANADVPLTAIALEQKFFQSVQYKQLQERMASTRTAFAIVPTPANGRIPGTSDFTFAQFGTVYTHSLLYHTRLCVARHMLLMKRNVGFVGPRLFSAVFMGLVLGSLFWQVGLDGYNDRFGLMLFAIINSAFQNMVEIPWSSESKNVIYKQVDVGMYPTVAYTFAVAIVHQFLCIPENILFSVIVYFMTGFTYDAGRFFFFLLVVLSISMAISTAFRFSAYSLKNPFIAENASGPMLALSMLFGGFLITYSNIPNYLSWLYWLSPVSWCLRSMSQSEFGAPRYNEMIKSNDTASGWIRKGDAYLDQWSIQKDYAWRWAGIGYCFALYIFFYIISTLSLHILRRPLTVGTRRLDRQEDPAASRSSTINISLAPSAHMAHAVGEDGEMEMGEMVTSGALPFKPITLAWKNITYTVKVTGVDGKEMDRRLLTNVDGFIKPGTLTALMGSTGAGKTTMMDLIAGLKTEGKVEGDILVNGFPKKQRTFNRVMGYVEQTDVHNGFHTVREALHFSARLRLPSSVSAETRNAFVEEVLDILELTEIADRIIGDETMSNRLSPGQMKRLTIGVELAANPSVLFLDEPTTGLDARSALVVLRVLTRIARTGRSVLCTIHQPSSTLFYMFDRLLLLQKTIEEGGRAAYFGPIGEYGRLLVHYFEHAPVPEHRRVRLPRYANPASWMLEVIGAGTSAGLSATEKQQSPNNPTSDPFTASATTFTAPVSEDGMIAYTDLYDASPLREVNMVELQEACQPKENETPLKFDSPFATSFPVQFVTVLYRLFQSYWRNVPYNLSRMLILLFVGIMFGLVYRKIDDTTVSGMMGKLSALFMTLGMGGVLNCATALPALSRDRAVFYRERNSFMYSSQVYAWALAVVELPYILVTVSLFLIPFYFLVGFQYTARHFFQYFLVQYIMALCFNYFGQFLVALTPNVIAANILMGFCFSFLFLFAGTFVRVSNMPRAWVWMYYITPIPKGQIAIAVTQWDCDPCPMIKTFNEGYQSQRDFVSEQLDTKFGVYGNYIGWLILTLCVVRFLVHITLAKVNHLKR